jgi:Glycosyl transferase family 11
MRIVVRQQSGLGNQMFQYVAGMYYAARYGADFRMAIDPPHHAFSYGSPRPFLLSHFTVSAPYKELTALENLALLTEHRRLRPSGGAVIQKKLLEKVFHLQIVTEPVEQHFRFQEDLPIKPQMRTILLVGYWQVRNIAEAISADVRKEFRFRELPRDQNLEMYRRIKDANNSVSLHIRRGDYTLEAEGNIALPSDYYSKAITYFKHSLNSPTFYVFSDDIEYAKASLGEESRAIFVGHNDSFSAHEDLRLMSACKHHIIANSTFSWWGAWLGSGSRQQQGIVAAPRRWLVGNCPVNNDLFPLDWVLLG